MNESKIIAWAQQLMAVAQCGLTYNDDNPYETERYHEIQKIASEMIGDAATISQEAVLELFSDESKHGYATPKVDARGVVFDQEGKILLVKEHRTQQWTFPGGWIDVGDTPSGAVEREVWEESGYQVKADRLLIVADRNLRYPPGHYHIYKLFFLCRMNGGEATLSHETDGVGFFAEDDLPELDLNRTSEYHLKRCFEYYRHPEMPTEFD